MDAATDDRGDGVPSADVSTTGGLRSRLGATAVALYLGVGGLVVISLWSALITDLLGLIGVSPGPGGRLLVGSVSTLLGPLTVAYFYFRWTDRDRSTLDFRVPTPLELGYVVAGVVGLFVLVGTLDVIFTGAGVSTAQHGIEELARAGDPAVLLPLVPASVLFVGPGEELLYRNLVQKRLYEAFTRPGAILVTSAVFAVVHFPAFALGEAVEGTLPLAATILAVLVLSLVLGVVYDLTRNTTVAALVHGLYDAVVFAVLYVELAGPPF